MVRRIRINTINNLTPKRNEVRSIRQLAEHTNPFAATKGGVELEDDDQAANIWWIEVHRRSEAEEDGTGQKEREMSELVKAILKITNESTYGWLDIDSVEAEQIKELIKQYLKTKEI